MGTKSFLRIANFCRAPQPWRIRPWGNELRGSGSGDNDPSPLSQSRNLDSAWGFLACVNHHAPAAPKLGARFENLVAKPRVAFMNTRTPDIP